MYGNNRLGGRRDSRRHSRRVEIEAGRIKVDKHGLRAQPGDCRSRREERVAGNDHFIAGSDVVGHQRQQQGIAPRSATHGMRHLAIVGQRFLERLDIRPEHEPP